MAALQSLTRISFEAGGGPPIVPKLIQLPRLQHLVFSTAMPCRVDARLWQARLPSAAMSSALSHLDISGHGLPHFPLALTQLVTLQSLDASGNEFAEVPAAITALSRLTQLSLGRMQFYLTEPDPLSAPERPLDARALGDLSGFPALCNLSFRCCEVTLCESMLGAVRHAHLTSLIFRFAPPAPDCALVVLQLRQALKRLGRGSVLKVVDCAGDSSAERALTSVQLFRAALKSCGL